MSSYTIAIVFSNWALHKVYDFMTDYLNARKEEIGMGKIERYKDKKTGEMKDSNRTIILMKKSLFDRAIDAGLDMSQPNLDFRIAEFIITDKYYPRDNQTHNLFINIPKTLSTTDCEILIKEKLDILSNFNLISNTDYSLRFPLESRITGAHQGFGILDFNDKVDIRTRVYVKALLHNSFLYFQGTDICYLPVFWAKKRSFFNKEQRYQILKKSVTNDVLE